VAALRRDKAASVIRIPVVEGARPRTNRNLQVGVLEIRARDVRMDLPAGTEVEVTFEIDSSRLVTVVADVPLVRVQVEAEIDLNNKRTPDQDELTDELREVEQRVARLRADAADEPDTQERLAVVDLSDVQEKVRTSRVDRADAVAAERKLRDHQAELGEVEDALRMPELLSDLQQGLDECAQEVEQSGRPEDRQELAELRRRADEVARDRDVVAAEKLLRRTFRFQVELLRRRADWPVIWFDALRRHRDHMHPLAQADRLIQDGERAIAVGDYRELSAVCEQLRRLVPPDTPDPVIYLGAPGR
jgi:molecular chaperone DnaK